MLGERVPIAILAASGCAIATYLTLYQLGMIATVWEPFFQDGSERVLHSFLSRLLPIPDAAVGALGYAAELIGGAIGGSFRYRSIPRFVLGYGAVVFIVALSGVTLALVQFFVIGAACTLCLTSAAISMVVAWLARHEVFAAWQTIGK